MVDRANISVLGIGGAGCNVIDYMLQHGIGGLHYIAADTDEQSLRNSACTHRISLGTDTKPRPFCHLSPEWCSRAAHDDRELIRQVLHGSELVVVVAGLGGNTGSGVAPVVCQLARESGIRVCAAILFPFPFEGRQRRAIAEASIEYLHENANEVSVTKGGDVIIGQKAGMTLKEALKLVNREMADQIVSMMGG